MNKLLENCLFLKDSSRFNSLRVKAIDFHAKYIGDTIVCDSIFDVLERFACDYDLKLKILKFPIEDKDFYAFTYIKHGIIFVTINTAQPLNNQIFAAAHELYHIYKYINNSEVDYVEKGSILTSNEINEIDITEEDREANAFASLVLAPKEQIENQSKISGKKFTESDLFDLIHFMNYFAMPYKAMVIKLFECERYNIKEADFLLSSELKHVMEEAYVLDCGTKWLEPTYDNNIASIKALIQLNQRLDNITESRAKDDLNFLNELERNLNTRKM